LGLGESHCVKLTLCYHDTPTVVQPEVLTKQLELVDLVVASGGELLVGTAYLLSDDPSALITARS